MLLIWIKTSTTTVWQVLWKRILTTLHNVAESHVTHISDTMQHKDQVIHLCWLTWKNSRQKLRSVIYRTYESDTECFIELRHIDNFCFLCHWPTKYQKGLKTGENIIKMNKQIWKNNERPHTHTHTHTHTCTHTQTNMHAQTLTSHTPHTSSRYKK